MTGTYHIYYWSECGTIPLTHIKVKARGSLAATDYLKTLLKKKHPGKRIHYRCHTNCTLHGDMFT